MVLSDGLVNVGGVLSSTVITFSARFDKQLFASSTCNFRVYSFEHPAAAIPGTLTVAVTEVAVVVTGFVVVTANEPAFVHVYI